MLETLAAHPLIAVVVAFTCCLTAYLVWINHLISSTPDEVKKLSPHRWTKEVVQEAYKHMLQNPITPDSYRSKLPPKLDRRYIITGGSGLVGGYLVLELIERGQSPESIRIVDFQEPHREDQLTGLAAQVDFVKADIASAESTEDAFLAPWDASVKDLPLTVFHAAAVIIPSARSRLTSGFCEAVNIGGTENVIAAAKKAGADVFISTSSASINTRPVQFWLPPWKWNSWPKNYWQIMDVADFFRPLRPHEEFFGNYPASKAKAERIVCAANEKGFRTGAVRPANGVYGSLIDNMVGGSLHLQTFPAWTVHIVQSFNHGLNCALAHLNFEAVLADPESFSLPQAGRPFVVTDPNPPISYGDLYQCLAALTTTKFRTFDIPPMVMLLLSYAIEAYILLPIRYHCLRKIVPPMTGDARHLQPGLFTITTHLIGSNAEASRPVEEGGLGYTGVVTTLEGVCQELIDWNRSQKDGHANGNGKANLGSVSLADELQKLGSMAKTVGA